MNFSKFSQNKLSKEQMLAVKGGEETCFEIGGQGKNILKACVDGCIVKVGVSYPCPDGQGWGWTQQSLGNWCESFFPW